MPDFKVLRSHWADKGGKRHRYAPGSIRSVGGVTNEIEAQVRVKILEPVEITEQADADSEKPGKGAKAS